MQVFRPVDFETKVKYQTDEESQKQTSNRLRSLLPLCPSCGLVLDAHSYALFAMAVLDNNRKENAYDLLHEVSNGNDSPFESSSLI